MKGRKLVRVVPLCLLALLPAQAPALEYRHGTSYLAPLAYAEDFEHFRWVNPDALQGGPESCIVGQAWVGGKVGIGAAVSQHLCARGRVILLPIMPHKVE